MTTELSIDPDQYTKKAKRIVAEDFNQKGFYLLTESKQLTTADDFYVTWFAKVLGNWKAMVSTDLYNGQYWEVTYNGDKKETYVDHYAKQSNEAYGDAGYDRRFPNG